MKVKYSTKTAAASNWCRVLTLNINVLLEPCVYIDTVSVLPSQRLVTVTDDLYIAVWYFREFKERYFSVLIFLTFEMKALFVEPKNIKLYG